MRLWCQLRIQYNFDHLFSYQQIIFTKMDFPIRLFIIHFNSISLFFSLYCMNLCFLYKFLYILIKWFRPLQLRHILLYARQFLALWIYPDLLHSWYIADLFSWWFYFYTLYISWSTSFGSFSWISLHSSLVLLALWAIYMAFFKFNYVSLRSTLLMTETKLSFFFPDIRLLQPAAWFKL